MYVSPCARPLSKHYLLGGFPRANICTAAIRLIKLPQATWQPWNKLYLTFLHGGDSKGTVSGNLNYFLVFYLHTGPLSLCSAVSDVHVSGTYGAPRGTCGGKKIDGVGGKDGKSFARSCREGKTMKNLNLVYHFLRPLKFICGSTSTCVFSCFSHLTEVVSSDVKHTIVNK